VLTANWRPVSERLPTRLTQMTTLKRSGPSFVAERARSTYHNYQSSLISDMGAAKATCLIGKIAAHRTMGNAAHPCPPRSAPQG
jgi:hypothetical protein